MSWSSVHPVNHYNNITDTWKDLMGDNFHFGYFDSPDQELSRATDALIDKMLELITPSPDTTILDVGCGIGNPAFYIHARYGCPITGISTSARGIELANVASRGRGYHPAVRFVVADGLDNGFPDQAFDVVWVMESSHLMLDKPRLCRECFRVLRPGGTLVLCDVVLLEMLPAYRWFLRSLTRGLGAIRAWGWAELNTLGAYCNGMLQAGFDQVAVYDITAQARPTLEWWIEGARRYGAGVDGRSTRKETQRFIRGCQITRQYFQEGTFGYGMLKAVKPDHV